MKPTALFRLIFRLFLIAGDAFGLYLTIRASGANVLNYYTLQSNILLLFFVLFVIVWSLKARPMPRWLAAAKLSVTMAILVTGLVFHVLLVPQSFVMGRGFPSSLSSHLLHTFTPLMALIDLLLFDDLKCLRQTDPLFCVVIPYAYAVYAYIYSALGGRFGSGKYPYFFMNVEVYGIAGVALWMLAITVIVLLLTYLLFALCNLLRRRIPAIGV